MKTKLLAVVLCFCMIVGTTGCGGTSVEDTEVGSERAASVDNGTLSEDSVTLSVGKTTVPYREYKVYYYFMKNQYEDVLTSDIWSYTDTAEGSKSIGQEAIEDVLRLIIQVKVICKAASAQGVKLEADEKEQANYNASTFCESLSEEVKQENGINPALMTQIFEENKLAEKMYNIVIGKVDLNISEEQSQAARVQLLYLKANADNKEQVKQKMDKLYQQAKSSGGSFYTLAKANTQAEEIEYVIGRLDSRTNLVNAVMGLKKYDVSNVIEEGDGYYLACCLQPSNKTVNDEYKNQVVEQRQTSAFQGAYQEWSEQYEVKVSKSLLVE
ncbi:MAG: peptidylprolyl isomerase [Lachnospiraceae bacterium]|nr:peptidylprolyl isomerase [Lachnospiraceae bacterium]